MIQLLRNQISSRLRTVVSALGLMVLLVSGCARAPEPLPLDTELAKASIEKFLSTWKSGGKPTDLPKAVPPIVVGDPDWESGVRLKKYEIVADQRSDGTNAHVKVKLDLSGTDGRRMRPEVVYIVGTNPVVTIQRQ